MQISLINSQKINIQMTKIYLYLTALTFLVIYTSAFNLSCNGRNSLSKITFHNGAAYTPSFYMTFGMFLDQGQVLTENITVQLATKNECVPNTVTSNFNFTASECKPFLGMISCGKKFYLNCSKQYKESNIQINFVAIGNITYQNVTKNCTDSGQIIVWEKNDSEGDGSDVGLIVGLVILGVVVVGIIVFLVCWKIKKGKRIGQQQQLLRDIQT